MIMAVINRFFVQCIRKQTPHLGLIAYTYRDSSAYTTYSVDRPLFGHLRKLMVCSMVTFGSYGFISYTQEFC